MRLLTLFYGNVKKNALSLRLYEEPVSVFCRTMDIHTCTCIQCIVHLYTGLRIINLAVNYPNKVKQIEFFEERKIRAQKACNSIL